MAFDPHTRTGSDTVSTRYPVTQRKLFNQATIKCLATSSHESMLKGPRPIIIIDGTEEFQDCGVTLKDLQDFYGSYHLFT